MKIGITRKRRGLDLVTLLLVLLLAIPHLCSAWILNYSRSAAHVSRGLSAFDALESVGRRPTSCFVLPQHSLMSDSDSEPRTMPSGDDNKNNASSSSANLPLRKRQRRPLLRHIPPIASQQKLEQSQTAAEMRQREAEKDPTLLTPFTFQSCSGSITSQDNTTTSTTLSLSPSLARALTEKLKLQRWTSIQAQTWPHAIAGRSILGKARTGTGKVSPYSLK